MNPTWFFYWLQNIYSFCKGDVVNKDVNIYEVNELNILGYQGIIYKEEVIALIGQIKKNFIVGYIIKKRIYNILYLNN